MQAWIEGVSTRKVDDLVAALGVESGISKSEVSRICSELDTDIAAWRERSLAEQATPYVFLDATYCKARVGGDANGRGGRVVSRAVVIATGVTADGHREVLGVDVGDSENEEFWTEFLRSLRDRGLHGVQLVISDAHRGLTNAIGVVCVGAAWQRCRVHFMRNALAKVGKGHAEMVAAAIRTIFTQPTGPGVRAHVETVAVTLDQQFPAVAELLRDARLRTSPRSLTSPRPTGARSAPRIRSSGSAKRSNGAPTSSGSSPTTQPCCASSACVLIEAHDEWQVSDRRYFSEASMAQLAPPPPTAIETRRDDTSNDTNEVIDTTTIKTA